MLLWIVAALSIGLVAAFTARAKGRPFKPWLAYGTLLGVVALPHALLLRDDDWRGEDGPDDVDERRAGGLFGFNPLAGRRADWFPRPERSPGWDAGELPPEGLVMRAPEPEAEADITPVWSEDDFARIAGDGGARRTRAATGNGHAFQDAASGVREEAPPVPETPTGGPERPAPETPEPREDFAETAGPAAYGPETVRGGEQPPLADQDAPTATTAGAEPDDAGDQPLDRVASSSVAPEAARAGQELPPAEVEPGHGAGSSFHPEPPPPPPEAPEPRLDIPLPPPASERPRRSRRALHHPRRMRQQRLWDGGVPAPDDYKREPRFEIGRDDGGEFDNRDAVRMARRFAPQGEDDGPRLAYEDRSDRRLGFRHAVAAVCVMLVVLLAWSQFGGLWAPWETDATQSATKLRPSDMGAPKNVSSAPVVPPESPGKDTGATAAAPGMPDVSGEGRQEGVDRKPSILEGEVPRPPPVPAARARLGMTAASPPEKAAGMEAVAPPSRKPAPPALSSGEGQDRAVEGKGEISATGDLVARIQAELQKRGYDIDSADGRAGTKTRNAIVAFKRDEGMPTTSMIDDALIERLGIAGRRLYPFTPPNRTVAR